MNILPQIFQYQNNQVRTVVENNEPWFVASDVCRILEISNPSDSLKRLDEDERTLVSIEGASNGLPVNAVNEYGLYNLILGSRKAEARQFKRWVTHEVIPSIRKHGAYMTPETIEKTLTDPDFIIGLATRLKEETARADAAQLKLESQRPLVVFAESLQVSKDSILIGELAKLLKQNGIDVGATRLFEILRQDGYLIKSGSQRNLPTQRSMNLGIMEIKIGSRSSTSEGSKATHTTKITGKGQIYFVNKFKNKLAKAQ